MLVLLLRGLLPTGKQLKVFKHVTPGTDPNTDFFLKKKKTLVGSTFAFFFLATTRC